MIISSVTAIYHGPGTIDHAITEREPHNGYLILQGGLPEVEEYVTSHWK